MNVRTSYQTGRLTASHCLLPRYSSPRHWLHRPLPSSSQSSSHLPKASSQCFPWESQGCLKMRLLGPSQSPTQRSCLAVRTGHSSEFTTQDKGKLVQLPLLHRKQFLLFPLCGFLIVLLVPKGISLLKVGGTGCVGICWVVITSLGEAL